MKILMLGWEYPPHIAGGLGTACQGLTKALSSKGIDIHFVVPQLFGHEEAGHMVLSDPERRIAPTSQRVDFVAPSSPPIETTRIPALLAPYWSASQYTEVASAVTKQHQTSLSSIKRGDPVAKALIDGEVYGIEVESALKEEIAATGACDSRERLYGVNIFKEVERFTKHVVSRFATQSFDAIHAHDWMTFPAGVALADVTGKPLVVHVHSLEHDRSGPLANQEVVAIEQVGLRRADKIIAVSYFTKRSIEKHYRIEASNVSVVHNGVYPREIITNYRAKKTWPRHVVLFLGRVTFQKGPDYFVEVAAKVVPHLPDVLFVLAGAGDMLPEMVGRVKELKLSNNFMFPGFMQGEELEEIFSVADLYVMPSVSEPFGLTALEAISFDTPVIISKQSGVAEVIQHALKVDFWDVDRMADLIINSLMHPELRVDLVRMAREELKGLHWDAAAFRTIEVYHEICVASGA